MSDQSTAQGSRLFSESLIRSYVDSPRFLKRDWLLGRVQAALDQPNCRFVLLTAEPGAGKSGFISSLADTHPDWPRYFIRRNQYEPLEDGGARGFLEKIGFQLAARFPKAFESDAVRISISMTIGTNSGEILGADIDKLIASPFYSKTLEIKQQVKANQGSVTGIHVRELVTDPNLISLLDLQRMALFAPAAAIQRLGHTEPIVILIDALDELRYRALGDTVLDWLTESPELPANVQIVVTCRADREWLALFRSKQQSRLVEEMIPQVGDDVRRDLSAYAVGLSKISAVESLLLAHRQPSESVKACTDRFVNDTVEKAAGNLGYLDALGRAIDQAIGSADQTVLQGLLELRQLPDTLQALHGHFLKLVRQSVGDLRVIVEDLQSQEQHLISAWTNVYRPILGVLAVAMEPLSRSQIRQLGRMLAGDHDVSDAIGRLRQFLDEEAGRYTFYHATLPEFLVAETTRQNPEYQELAVDPTMWHSVFVKSYRGQAVNWGQVDWYIVDDYGFRHLPFHLCFAMQIDQLNALLLDFGWLSAKLTKMNVRSMIADYALADSIDTNLVRDALRLSAHILEVDKSQLPSQIAGRLAWNDAPGSRALVNGARKSRRAPWLCPQIPALEVPGGPLLRTMKGHNGTPRSVVITPDGLWAITAGNSSHDQTVRVWNLSTGECRHTFEGQVLKGGFTPVALSANGNRAITAFEGKLCCWDVDRGELLDELQFDGTTVTAVALAKDDHQVLFGLADGSVHVWNISQRTTNKLPSHPESIEVVAIATDGTRAISVSASQISVWDLESQRAINLLRGPTDIVGPLFGARCFAVSPDGRQIYYGTPLRRWDITQNVSVLLGNEQIDGAVVAITTDGGRVISTLDIATLAVWDLRTRNQVVKLSNAGIAVSVFAMTPDGTRAITGDFEHDLRVWDLTIPVRSERPPDMSNVQFVDFEGANKAVVLRTPDGVLRLWDIDMCAYIPDTEAASAMLDDAVSNAEHCDAMRARVTEQLRDMVISCYSTRIVNSGGWTEDAIASHRSHFPVSVVVSLDGARAISTVSTGGKYGDHEEPVQADTTRSLQQLLLWDLHDRPTARELPGHSTAVSALDITPDGRWAITGCSGRTIRVWDLNDGTQRCVLPGHMGIVYSVSISDDGRRAASASEDGTVRLWNLEIGQLVAAFTGEGPMKFCKIAPDGSAVVASEQSQRLHILKFMAGLSLKL